MSLTITGGYLKGLYVETPSYVKKPIKPVESIIRKALMDVIEHRIGIDGKIFLDMFAGSGIVGIEAISRGAEKVIFVDNNPSSISVIKKNIKRLGIETKAEVIKSDWKEFLENFVGEVDISFADPFYDFDSYEKLIDFLRKITKEVIIIKHSKKVGLQSASLVKSYGDSVLSFYYFT